MTDPWFTSDQLRTASGVRQPADEARVARAAATARGKVRELCGPVYPAEAIVERVRVRRPVAEVALKYRPAALTAIAGAASGTAYTVGDFDVDGQVLYRTDEGLIGESLTVSYTAGYATVDEIPDALVEMATLIGQQLLRVGRRYSLSGDPADQAATSFAVPNAALDAAGDYLLAPGGFA